MRLDDLVPADENPKLHDMESLGDSIDRFGFIEPMILDDRTGKLVAGHGRRDSLLAAEAAGEDLPEGVTVDDDGHWRAPVQRGWASADDDEADAALVALNGVAAAGGSSNEVLDKMLTRLATTSPRGLRGTGYGTKKTDSLMKRLSAPKPLRSKAKELRELRYKFILIRVPLHRAAEVAPHVAAIAKVPEVTTSESDKGDNRPGRPPSMPS